MRTIWKYEFEISDEVQVKEMPDHAGLLDVQPQDGVICMWMIVDTEARKVKRSWRVYGTGHPINDEQAVHYGTVQIGQFVWHLFEID